MTITIYSLQAYLDSSFTGPFRIFTLKTEMIWHTLTLSPQIAAIPKAMRAIHDIMKNMDARSTFVHSTHEADCKLSWDCMA